MIVVGRKNQTRISSGGIVLGFCVTFLWGFFFSYFFTTKIILFVINVAFVHFMGGTMLCVLFFFVIICVSKFMKNFVIYQVGMFYGCFTSGPPCVICFFLLLRNFFPVLGELILLLFVYTLCFLCIKGGVGQIIMPNTFSPIVFFKFFGKST